MLQSLPRVLPERIEIGTPIKMIASLACFIVAANVTTEAFDLGIGPETVT
jgi:hypothetical protein